MNENKKMNPEVKARWLAALRSRKYKKGIGALREVGWEGKEEFCCLGVLCELAVEAGVIPPPERTYFKYTYQGNTAFLPIKVQQWAGLNSESPFFYRSRKVRPDQISKQDTLAKLNDHSKTFTPVIRAIERYF